ncbi:MAG: restriction endonuclease [Bacteroidetes bacterium]|nr:restriction endonuclease [Bacteroidota bacterium]
MTSKEYELFVKTILENISKSLGQSVSEIQHNKTISGNTRKWKVDLSLSYEVLKLKHQMFIECKHWNKVVDVNSISKIHDCIRDCGAHKGVVATTLNFTEPAIVLAQKLGIGMLIVSDDKNPEFHNFTGKQLSFEDANNDSHWFTSTPQLKILSGTIFSDQDFLKFLELRAGKLARQIFETKNINLLQELSKDDLSGLGTKICDAFSDFELTETGGLPLSVQNIYLDQNLLRELLGYIAEQTWNS